MPLAGYFVYAHPDRFSLPGVALAGAVGCVIGSAIAYWIGATGGRPLILKYGKYILISKADVDRADRWFEKYGNSVAFFSRLMPVIRTYISFPAGISRMNFWRFTLFTFLGSLIWSFALAWVGYMLGPAIGSDPTELPSKLGSIFHGLDIIIIVLLAAGVGYYIYRHVKHDRDFSYSAITPGGGATGQRVTVDKHDAQVDGAKITQEGLPSASVTDAREGVAGTTVVTTDEGTPAGDFEPRSPSPSAVAFTSYYPREVVLNRWDPLLVFVSLDSHAAHAAVASQATERLAQDSRQYRSIAVASSTLLTRGTRLTVIPYLPGFQFDPAALTIHWQEDVQGYEFRMRALQARPDQATNGVVRILEGPLLRGEIPISVFVAREDSPSRRESEGETLRRFTSTETSGYRNTFPSYAHRDVRIVRAFEAVAEAAGDRFLRDVRALRAGQTWSEELLNLIGQADVFQLFWSRAAAHSTYVEREWRHAMKIHTSEPARPNFVRPVFWSRSPYRIPPELQPIEFGRIEPDDLRLPHISWFAIVFHR